MDLISGILILLAIGIYGSHQNQLETKKAEIASLSKKSQTPLMLQCNEMCSKGMVTEFKQGSIKCECNKGD